MVPVASWGDVASEEETLTGKSLRREFLSETRNWRLNWGSMAGRKRILALLVILSLPAAAVPSSRAAQIRNSGPSHGRPVTSSTELHIGSDRLHVDFAEGHLDLPQAAVLAWIETAARSVSVYYGRFPVPGAHILVVPRRGAEGVLEGTTWGDVRGYPALTRMVLGEHTTAADLQDDWTMTHEFVHLALPSLADQHHWLEEGLATYVEPIARVQAGGLPAQRIWADMVRDMPKGEPGPGDQGLDRTHTWGRTYWGGALFCLRADVAIREKTGNRRGLQDALRGILAAGGTIAVDWPIERVLRAGDAATGTTVLIDLYKEMATTPQPIDLNALWSKLGIHVNRQPIVFDASAPLAALRTSITARPPAEQKLPQP